MSSPPSIDNGAASPAAVTDASRPDGLERVGEAVRQHPVVVLFVLLALPAIGVALALTRDDEYRATSTLLLAPSEDASAGARIDGRDAATTRELLDSRAVAARASETLPGTDTDEVADAVDVRSDGDANVLVVEARDGSADRAMRIADAYARVYTGVVDRIEPISARPPSATVLAPAEPAEKVERRSVLAFGLIGLGIAVPLALLGAPLLRTLDRRVKDASELEEIYGLPVLARIPRSRTLASHSRKGRAEAATNTVGFSEEAEAFRTLRTNLRYFNVDAPVRSILVASPLSGDGKSTVARHLAITMAAMGDSVCLVNADLRKHETGVVPSPDGLSLVLAGFEVEGALTEVAIAYDPVSEESRVLVELASGPLPPNPAELLESERMRWLIAQLERRFDLVIIDSPALVTVSDALTLVPRVSGVLIVGGVGQTMRQAAVDLRKQIDLLGGRSLGVVANFSTASRRYYGYYDSDGGGTRRARPEGRPAGA